MPLISSMAESMIVKKRAKKRTKSCHAVRPDFCIRIPSSFRLLVGRPRGSVGLPGAAFILCVSTRADVCQCLSAQCARFKPGILFICQSRAFSLELDLALDYVFNPGGIFRR